MNAKLLAAALGATLLTAPSARAQGADLCTMAQPISGTGMFAFDTTAATTDGLPDALCDFFGNQDIFNDVWYAWTAPNDGFFRAFTCNQTTLDTKLAVYAGACNAAVLACDDDACASGLQSQVEWTAVGGQVYFLRLGSYSATANGTGTLTIQEDAPLLNPANGHYYLAVAQTGILWTDAKAAAEATSYQGVAGHLATVQDQAESDWLWANLGNTNGVGLEEYWLGGFQNTSSPSYSEPSGGWEWVTGEPFTFTNWAAGEPNDSPAPEDFVIYMPSSLALDQWNDAQVNHWSIRGYVVEFETGSTSFCAGDGTAATCPCSNPGANGAGCDNSFATGGGKLTASGTTSVSGDNLVLSVEGLPPTAPGLYFQGTDTQNGGFGVPFGDGLRCIGGTVVRLGTKSSVGGASSFGAGVGSDPLVSVKGLVPGAGGTRYYQVWYRNSAAFCTSALFNLTNALQVDWQM